jgi:hypothetical protein
MIAKGEDFFAHRGLPVLYKDLARRLNISLSQSRRPGTFKAAVCGGGDRIFEEKRARGLRL